MIGMVTLVTFFEISVLVSLIIIVILLTMITKYCLALPALAFLNLAYLALI
jgi:hypothetical protein